MFFSGFIDCSIKKNNECLLISANDLWRLVIKPREMITTKIRQKSDQQQIPERELAYALRGELLKPMSTGQGIYSTDCILFVVLIILSSSLYSFHVSEFPS